ncbi:hypothetical protein BDZ89DRAFT_1089855 [Hymenopellis radicata]|nr:hypothetical protein BDZ89DRAFT_1089855 [Hymenopellis radicata]
MAHVPKAVLYYSPKSIWSSVGTLNEKGYGDDEVDLKVVDLSKGENFDPTFLRLNRKATVPTLVVPLENSLSDEVESRYKALNQSRAIVELLDKSRSAVSRTHTTSHAAAPALAPATVAFTSTSNLLLDLLHSDEANPNNFLYLHATDETALKVVAGEMVPYLTGKQEALAKYIADAEAGKYNVSVNVTSFWKEKKDATDLLLQFYANAHLAQSELSAEDQAKRTELFAKSKGAKDAIKGILRQLCKEIIGPYALGDQLSIVDCHLMAWLSRILLYSGVEVADDGAGAVGKLEKYLGSELSTEEKSKLGTYWECTKTRDSWKKVYVGGLH